MNTLRFFAVVWTIIFMAPTFAAEEFPPQNSLADDKANPTSSQQTLISKSFTLQQQLRVAQQQVAVLQAQLQQLRMHAPSMYIDHRHAEFEQEIESLIRSPRFSFEGLEETLSERQQEIRTFIVTRSRNPNPPKMARGLLLLGPPGNGKNRFPEALAYEAAYEYCSVPSSFFNTGCAGDGGLRVQAIKKCVRKHPKMVIVIDELDAMGKRANLGSGSAANMTQTMSMLLWASIEPIQHAHPHVIFIAATNAIEHCDHALTDRFSKRIPFNYPSVAQMDIARDYHLREYGCSLVNDITWPYHTMPEESPKLSFRDITDLVCESRDLAYSDNTTIITQAHVDKAWGYLLEKKEQDERLSEEEKKRQREVENHKRQKQTLELQRTTHEEQKKQFKANYAMQVEARAIQFCSLDGDQQHAYLADYAKRHGQTAPSRCLVM